MKQNQPNFCNQLNRREFIKDIGGGFAALGLTGMLAQDGFFASKAMAKVPDFVNPLAPKGTASPSQGKVGNLSFHVRWAQSYGYL